MRLNLWGRNKSAEMMNSLTGIEKNLRRIANFCDLGFHSASFDLFSEYAKSLDLSATREKLKDAEHKVELLEAQVGVLKDLVKNPEKEVSDEASS